MAIYSYTCNGEGPSCGNLPNEDAVFRHMQEVLNAPTEHWLFIDREHDGAHWAICLCDPLDSTIYQGDGEIFDLRQRLLIAHQGLANEGQGSTKEKE